MLCYVHIEPMATWLTRVNNFSFDQSNSSNVRNTFYLPHCTQLDFIFYTHDTDRISIAPSSKHH